MTALRVSAFMCASLAALGACSRPVRIVAGTNNSLVVNNRLTVPLPVYGVDARGRRQSISGLTYERVGGDPIELTPDGRVTCVRRADARVRVTRGRLTKTFSLLCRPILTVSVERVWLLTGGDSSPFVPHAKGVNGEAESLLAGVVSVVDTSIAYVDHGEVFGRRAGQTQLMIDAGDCHDWSMVDVNERVSSSIGLEPFQLFIGGPMELASGEMRTWRVTPGSYEMWTNGDSGFAFGTSNINCAQGSFDDRYRCIALPNATVIVRNMRRTGAVRGVVYVRRSLDTDRDSAYLRVHPLKHLGRERERRLPPGWCSGRVARGASK